MFNGPVTCLEVTGNRAIIGIEDATGSITFEVVDNSATGTADTIGYVYSAAGCPPRDGAVTRPLDSGNFVVHDARG
ncbi:MAG: hypothetical protein ABWZ52_14315 [Acidimicrobiales bacterium]